MVVLLTSGMKFVEGGKLDEVAKREPIRSRVPSN
jgi:hypothetical protein